MNGPNLCCAACEEVTNKLYPLCDSCKTQLEVHGEIDKGPQPAEKK